MLPAENLITLDCLEHGRLLKVEYFHPHHDCRRLQRHPQLRWLAKSGDQVHREVGGMDGHENTSEQDRWRRFKQGDAFGESFVGNLKQTNFSS